MKKIDISKITLNNDFNNLIKMCNNDKKSEDVLHELSFFNKYLLNNQYNLPYHSKANNNIIEEIKPLNELTKVLCTNTVLSINSINMLDNLSIKRDKVNIENMYNKISYFLSEYFKNDMFIAEHLFDQERIKISKSFTIKSEMYYLRNLKEYYVKILYHGKLSEKEISEIIHEIGHISEFISKGSDKTLPEGLLGETIAKVYEFKYIDSICSNNPDKKVFNMAKLFLPAELRYLEYNFNYCNNGSIKENIGIIVNLYSSLVALLLLNDENCDLKLEYLKKHIDTAGALEVLNNVNINENNLVCASRNIKKLILKKD